MRKLRTTKIIKLTDEEKYKSLLLMGIANVLRAFSELFVWRTNLKVERFSMEKMVREVEKASKSNKKVSFIEKPVFNDYDTSALIKQFIKIHDIEIEEISGYQRDGENYVDYIHKFAKGRTDSLLKRIEGTAQYEFLKTFKKWVANDCNEIQTMVYDYVVLKVAIQELVNIWNITDGKRDYRVKFVDKFNKWARSFVKDVFIEQPEISKETLKLIGG